MIATFEQLPDIHATAVAENKTIALMGGCFDLVHEGHLEQFEFAQSKADLLVVGIVRDEVVRARKGLHRPIQHQDARLRLVSALESVDHAFILPEAINENSSPTIMAANRLRPDFLVIHGEQDLERRIQDVPLLSFLGVELVYNPAPKRSSTTDIVRRANGLIGV